MDNATRSVGILIERFDDKILILHHKTGTADDDSNWGIVSGGVEDGERPLQALIRSTKSEVNLDLNLSRLYHVKNFHWQKVEGKVTLEVYKIRFDELEVKVSLNKNGHSEYLWIDPKECFKRSNLTEGLHEVLKDVYY